MDNLDLYLKTLEKEKHIKPKANKMKHIIKIKAEINELENMNKENQQRKIRERKSLLFAKIRKIKNL